MIFLAQVNKALRRMLMHRSASPIWRTCIENIGLVPCPPGVSEPRYISVLYLPLCSSCGAQTERSPDVYLLVRFCPGCSKQHLVDWNKISSADVQSLVLASGESHFVNKQGTGFRYSLKQEVEATKARLRELQLLNDKQALQAWVKAQKAELERRKQHGDAVTSFLNAARQAKMDELKRKRKEQIECKLLELGYAQKEEDLPPYKQSHWRSFFDKADVLTDQEWSQLRPIVLEFLDIEAKDRIERERNQRHSNRDDKLRDLFNSIRHVMNTLPEAPESLSIAEATTVIAKWIPPPDYDDALEWSIVRDLLETDRTVEEMADCFEEQRHEIIKLIKDWGRQVKREWASILKEGRKKDGLVVDPPRPRLYVSEADADPFENMDADTSLLLRADSIFYFNSKARRAAPNILTYDMLALHLSSVGQTSGARNSGTLDLADYAWYSKASLVARTLLRAMGREDATIIEFHASNPLYFTCGRCNTPGSFLSMILHYAGEASKWESIQEHLPTFASHGIVYNYVHDPESNNPKPLLGGSVSADEADAMVERLSQSTQSSHNRFKCRLCERGMPRSPFFYDVASLSSHLIDV